MVDTNIKKDDDKGSSSQSTSQLKDDGDGSKSAQDIKDKGSMSGYSTDRTKTSY